MELNDRLASLLLENGAVAFGSAPAEPVEEEQWSRFESWLANGHNAGMDYMRNYPDIRRDPRLLLDGAQTIVSIAFNYRQPNPFPGVATYALGEDYHKVLRRRLKAVVKAIGNEFGGTWRICIDSAPVLERYWALKCGVGQRSPLHGNIVVKGVGSMVFLAELVTTLRIDGLKSPRPSGDALMSVDVRERLCPTGALLSGGVVDAGRCINYLTIEKREPLTETESRMVGNARFGCDLCQRVCEENRGDCPEVLPEFRPLDGLGRFLEGETSGFDLAVSPLARSVLFH